MTNVEGKGVVDGDGDQYGDDGDSDNMESGSNIDSQGVEENIPMSSRPPIHCTERPYRVVIRRWRCGRIKSIPTKVNQMPKVEITYPEHKCIMQPPVNDSKRSYRVIGLIHRHSQVKIEPTRPKIEHINDKNVQEVGTIHQIHTSIAWPLGNARKCRYGVVGLRR